MSRFLRASLMTCWSLLGCGSSGEVAPPPAEPSPPPPVVSATPSAAAPAPSAAPPLSPEEQKKAEEQKKLERDFEELRQSHAAEVARLTPEIHQSARALADKSYPSLRAALTAALASPHRRPGSAARDAQRHPQQTLEFLGLRPNMTVLEYGPGEAWYTELLAPALAKNGKLYVTTADPAGPTTAAPTLYAQRTKLFLEALPEAYGKVEPVIVDGKAPSLPFEGKLDAVLLFRGLHGMVNNQSLEPWLAAFHRALKPNGVLGIEQHRAAAGADPLASSKKGYLPEAFVIEKIEAAGFKLAGKSEVNANPKDTKDYPEGVWSLPPTLREGDKDRAKYEAIGESDRMTLKFVRVAPKAK